MKRAYVLDGRLNGWDNPTMSTSKVDSKKRIVLPNGRPGDVFDIQQEADGRFVLVRLQKPERGRQMSRAECLKAMRAAPLRPTVSWEELRELTREP
jgi:bifunctional DNA-binding transcriptional regulator/antitoxin component of YhaV-PrlF toxin-antitoxin module